MQPRINQNITIRKFRKRGKIFRIREQFFHKCGQTKRKWRTL